MIAQQKPRIVNAISSLYNPVSLYRNKLKDSEIRTANASVVYQVLYKMDIEAR